MSASDKDMPNILRSFFELTKWLNTREYHFILAVYLESMSPTADRQLRLQSTVSTICTRQ